LFLLKLYATRQAKLRVGDVIVLFVGNSVLVKLSKTTEGAKIPHRFGAIGRGASELLPSEHLEVTGHYQWHLICSMVTDAG